jgi:hypothetical protein
MMVMIGVRPSLPDPRLQAAHLHAERYRLDLRWTVHHHKRQIIPGHDQHNESLPRGWYVLSPFFLSSFCSLWCLPPS